MNHRRKSPTRRLLALGAGLLMLGGLVGFWSWRLFRHQTSLQPVVAQPVPEPPRAARRQPPSFVNVVPDLAQASGDGTVHARDPGEWQGMRVNLAEIMPCVARDGCGLGLACRAGQCLACRADTDCAENEACAMDHCLPRRNVGCRSRKDCKDGELCILTGYSASPRGNDDMRASCKGDSGDEPVTEEAAGEPAQPEQPAVPRPPMPVEELSQTVQEHAKKFAPR